jgi:DNA-binding transcriptional LysR family regulator
MRGQLIISSLMSISHRVLPAALVTFRKKHPKMHVQIREGSSRMSAYDPKWIFSTALLQADIAKNR